VLWKFNHLFNSPIEWMSSQGLFDLQKSIQTGLPRRSFCQMASMKALRVRSIGSIEFLSRRAA
jgi:hypothetical protein